MAKEKEKKNLYANAFSLPALRLPPTAYLFLLSVPRSTLAAYRLPRSASRTTPSASLVPPLSAPASTSFARGFISLWKF
jgi:hypothetical protein